MKEFLIVDGYNVIFGWPELKKVSEDSLEHARLMLKDLLQNYGRYKGYDEVVLVFDGKTTGKYGTEEALSKDFLLVFTGEGETADSYIEKAVYNRQNKFVSIYVATSDEVEQHQILGSGGLRISVRELRASILAAKEEERQYYEESKRSIPQRVKRNELISFIKDKKIAKALEDIRHNR